MTPININTLFADIIDTPEQRQQKLLQQGMTQGNLLSSNLTGLARAAAPLAQMAGQLGVQRNEDLRRGVQPLLGLDPRTTGEKIQEQIQGLDPSDPNSLLKAAQALESIDPIRAASLRQLAVTKRRENEDRLSAQKSQELSDKAAQLNIDIGEQNLSDARTASAATARRLGNLENTARAIMQKDQLLGNLVLRESVAPIDALKLIEQKEQNNRATWGNLGGGVIFNTGSGDTKKVEDLNISQYYTVTDGSGATRVIGLSKDPNKPVALNVSLNDLANMQAGGQLESTIAGDGSVAEQGTVANVALPASLGGATTQTASKPVNTIDPRNAIAKVNNVRKSLATAREVLDDSIFASGRIPAMIGAVDSPLLDATVLQPQRDLNELFNTVNANIAFDELAKMRAQSKTGAALGNVSNIELELLRSTVAALSTLRDPELLRIAMNDVERHYNNFLALELGPESGLSVDLDLSNPIYQGLIKAGADNELYYAELDANGDPALNEDGQQIWFRRRAAQQSTIEEL